MRRPAIGILLLDYEYSGVPGGLRDHTALEYETRRGHRARPRFEAAKAGQSSPGLEAAFRDAVDELQTGGGGDLVGISGNCGFMMFYQALVRAAWRACRSSCAPLLQAPLVAGALPPSGIILVLTASKADLMAAKEVLLTKAAIRVDDRDQVPRARNSARNLPRNSAQFSDGRHAPSSQLLIEGLDDLDGFARATRRAARWTSRKSSAASSRA